MGVGVVEVALGTVETFGTGVACELVSWSFAGSGVVGVVGTFGTLVTGAVCGLISWLFARSGSAGVVGTFGTFETLVTAGSGDVGAVEGSSTGYWARQGWPGRV